MISTTVMIKLGRVKGNRMVNMQLSNRKLIDRGVQMLIDELHINKAEAKQFLQEQGSVKRHWTLTKQIIVSLKTTEV